MGKINYVNKDNYINKIITFLNYKSYKIPYNYNFDNIEFRNKIETFLFSNNEQYKSSDFEDIMRIFNNELNIEIFGGNKHMSHKADYIIFYIGRGWTYNEAKEMVYKYGQMTRKIFFNKDDILQFFVTEKSYDINLNNKEYVKSILEYILIPFGNICEYLLCELLRTYWIGMYPEMKNKTRGFVINNISYWIARGYSEDEARNIITKKNKQNTIWNTNVWENKGYTKEEAKLIVSDILSKNSKKSKAHPLYWKKLGLSEENAKQKAYEYNVNRSVWSKKHWLELGYSEEEASLKCLEYNASSKLCKKYKNDITKFYNHLLNMSHSKKELFELHRIDLYNEKDNDKKIKMLKLGYGTISKSEQKCFDVLKNINNDIEHKPYIVAFPDDFISMQNKVCYICDGYLKYNDLYIIFEYDGGIGKYHDEDIDLIKSEEILIVDEQVLGIIRIQESLFKNYDKILHEGGLEGIFKKAINDIITCKEQIIILK